MSFARAIADDLRATGSFEQVAFPAPGGAGAAQLELRGRIRRTAECKSLNPFGYLFGQGSLLFTLLPVPYGEWTVVLAVDLWLLESPGGAVVWQATLEESSSRRVGRYTRKRAYGRDTLDTEDVPVLDGDVGVDTTSIFQWEFELLRRGMLDARPPLIEAARAAFSP